MSALRFKCFDANTFIETETIKALGKTDECKKMRNETNSRHERHSVPRRFNLIHTSRDKYQILPAGACTCCQARHYDPDVGLEICIYMYFRNHIQFKLLTPSWFKIHKIIDIKTGKCLKPVSAIVPDELGSFGDLVISSEPGLYRVNKDSQEVILCPTMLLVELKYPLGKCKRTCA